MAEKVEKAGWRSRIQTAAHDPVHDPAAAGRYTISSQYDKICSMFAIQNDIAQNRKEYSRKEQGCRCLAPDDRMRKAW